MVYTPSVITSNLADLTKEVFEQLYVKDGLTEAEIAEKYGTYQVKVNRLRATFGIPKVSKADRYQLPEISRQQKSLLFGSMLGDGRLSTTGPLSAGYTEYHSDGQREYLQWKADQWGPFVASIRPEKKVKDGKVYTGSILRLKACRQFKHYWEVFYPEGKGHKTFTQLPLSNITGLALAVWFMDDGSRTSGGHIRFAVSPRPEDQEVLLRLLAKFGIEGHVYSSNGNHELLIQDRMNLDRFVTIVAKHIPPCMSGKLDLKPRALGQAPRHKLTPEVVLSFVGRGMGVLEIAKTLNVSTQSVKRGMAKAGLPPGKVGRPPRTTSGRLTTKEADSILESMGLDEMTEDMVLAVLQRTVFPTRQVSESELRRDFALLQASTTRIDSGHVVGKPVAGIVLCDYFFGHRFDASYEQLSSVRTAWHTPELLRKAIRFQIAVGDPLRAINVYRALRGIVKTPSNFRPGVAKALVEHFCPHPGLVLDPCAGYGGRAAGVLAARRSYVGVDPHPQAGQAFTGLFSFLKSEEGQFYNQPFEEVDLSGLQADMLLTSPPYFHAERYSCDPTQSWVRYKTWEVWVAKFLRVLIEKSFAHLKSGGCFCLNVADVGDSKSKRPLVATSVALAQDVGFKLEATINMPLGRFGKTERAEPILVLRKGSCSLPNV